MSYEEKDIDEQLFNEALASKRHKELISSLNGIAVLLDDDAISAALKKQSESIVKVSDAIQKQLNKEVKVEVSNTEILPLLADIKKGNENILLALQNKPLVDEFRIQDTDAYTKTVKVIYKKSSEIIIKNG